MVAKRQGFGQRVYTLCVLILAADWAAASNAETFAVLSIVGDHLTIIGMGAQLGSHIDQNRRQTLAVNGTGFDDFAVSVVDATIAKARPEASVTALRVSDPALYRLGESWIDSDTVEAKQLMSFLPEAIAQSPDARLHLVTPYRAELELKTAHDLRGAGKASGLGFYLDHAAEARGHRRAGVRISGRLYELPALPHQREDWDGRGPRARGPWDHAFSRAR